MTEVRLQKVKSKLWRRQWHPTPVLLPGKSHGRRSLVGFSPWGREGSDTTERLHFHFKEKDLVLAARLGKALLERNQDMSRQYEQMHKELTDKLEVRTSLLG